MKDRLDEYCRQHFGELVKIVRAEERLGLIRAKNLGARQGLLIRGCVIAQD